MSEKKQSDAPALRRALPIWMSLLILLATMVVASLVDAAIVGIAELAGVPSSSSGLNASVFITFTVLGLLGAYGGWRLIRRVTRRPARVLSIVVPMALALSWIPDISLGLGGDSVGGVITLMTMHLAVAALAVVACSIIAPVTERKRAEPASSVLPA